MDHRWFRPVNPRVFHYDRCIAHAGDEVDEEFVAMSLAQPDRITDFTIESLTSQAGERRDQFIGGQEYVEVFSVAANAGMFPQGESAGHSQTDVALLQKRQHLLNNGCL